MSPVPRDGSLACTYHREGAWFIQQLNLAGSANQVPPLPKLRAELDATTLETLERARRALVVCHGALRTRFVGGDGVPRQVVSPNRCCRNHSAAVVYRHLHIQRTTWRVGFCFAKLSVGCPREWLRRSIAPRGPRQIHLGSGRRL